MKTKDILELMSKLFADLKLHSLFIEEIRSLLKKELRGKESEFFRVLGTQLSNIQQFGSLVYTVDSNEKLKGLDRTYYSIHLQRSQFNVRMLIYITPNPDKPEKFFCISSKFQVQ